MPTGAAGATLQLAAVYQDGTGSAVVPTTPLVDIIDPLGATVINNAVPSATLQVGRYEYDFAVPLLGPLGSWTATWTGIINGANVESSEVFQVVAAGSISFGPVAGSGGLCQSWFDPDVACGCAVEDFGQGVLERWGMVASVLLYARTGRRFPGICSDLVRPCRPGPSANGQRLAYAFSGGDRPIAGACSCRGDGMAWGCGCEGHSAILLPHKPVRRILSVELEGVALDRSAYRLVNRRWLVRADGAWPCCQSLGAADGEPGTWSVSYEYGIAPPAGGPEVAAVYACELAKSCTGDDTCRLPRRVQNLTREGVTMTIIDPFDFFEEGLTGLYEVDAWIGALNPAKIDRAGKVINVDLLMSHRST